MTATLISRRKSSPELKHKIRTTNKQLRKQQKQKLKNKYFLKNIAKPNTQPSKKPLSVFMTILMMRRDQETS
ncbi:hypothetical protein BCEN4_740138 [Burkholderia cenocepacia]|nr:hypothetical protein BCEN4_740138 [Burkholderia cenocepacia]